MKVYVYLDTKIKAVKLVDELPNPAGLEYIGTCPDAEGVEEIDFNIYRSKIDGKLLAVKQVFKG